MPYKFYLSLEELWLELSFRQVILILNAVHCTVTLYRNVPEIHHFHQRTESGSAFSRQILKYLKNIKNVEGILYLNFRMKNF
jgi:hypothetical protein